MPLATLSCTNACQWRNCTTESGAPPPLLLRSTMQQRRKCLTLRIAIESCEPSRARSATFLLVGGEPLGLSDLERRSASRRSTAALQTPSALACQVPQACSSVPVYPWRCAAPSAASRSLASSKEFGAEFHWKVAQRLSLVACEGFHSCPGIP